ncbi:sugar kinase [Candidatus Caldarchaeum subterraneum]|uniref:ADP-dependent (S)-NAD(P)H-hydrate dehydratase n=1 Tax=Caldiarchaeum subterraneum TaxID=311458 RepID=E6N4B6_CALS0|nr:sugar kinase [Candidatus Caldarchaeum subterraneum]BAJ49962.1 sugar kinase [Candidatus Caldarchaeum subterraneum]
MAVSWREAGEEDLARACVPRRAWSRKGDNGVVLVVGGSWLYHGAPFLVSMAAMRTGVDLVYTAAPEKVATAIRALSPSLIVLPLPDYKLTSKSVDRIVRVLDDVNAAAVGPGLARGCEKGLLKLVRLLVERNIAVVLDATALFSDVLLLLRGARAVVTPHAGEFRRLFGEEPGSTLEERVEKVYNVAKQFGVTVLLKGHVDVVSDGVEVVVNRKQPLSSAMTVGGTGDVLTGVVAGFLARMVPPFHAAVAAAVANGYAGVAAAEKLGLHITPEDVIGMLPVVLKRFDRVV